MAKQKKRLNPHKHFILGKNCPQCAIENDGDEHAEHIHSYLHDGDEQDPNKRKLIVFRSYSEAEEYVDENFPDYADEIVVLPLSEASFGSDDNNPEWGDDDVDVQ